MLTAGARVAVVGGSPDKGSVGVRVEAYEVVGGGQAVDGFASRVTAAPVVGERNRGRVRAGGVSDGHGEEERLWERRMLFCVGGVEYEECGNWVGVYAEMRAVYCGESIYSLGNG